MAHIDKYFTNPNALPTMPELATRLLRSMERDDLSIAEIADLIERDHSLAVKVLRLANSARYGSQRNVASVGDAAARIGLRGLRDLALAACMTNLFPNHAEFNRMRFWRHSVATAGHARAMAPLCGQDPDVAYLGGLVLRTGRILMLMVDGDDVARSENMADTPDSLMAHERSLMGCSHAEVSAELARRWNFPPLLCTALDAAGDPLGATPFSSLGAVLRLASTLADAGDLKRPETLTVQTLHGSLVMRLDLDLPTLAQVMLPYDKLTAGVDQLLA